MQEQLLAASEDDPTVLRQYITGMQDVRSAEEKLTSAMSLRSISLENYSSEMLKTHYHELFIVTRTSIQDPSIRPQGGNRSNTFFIIEQGEYEGEKGL